MLFVDLWQSPILVFTNYETCLKDSMKYINKIFENENEITIVNELEFDFYKGKYVEEGLEIYKNGNILRKMEELRNELPINEMSVKKIIKNKI